MSKIRHQSIAPTDTWRLSPGAAVDLHRHDDDQLIYCSDGVLEVVASDATWFTPSTQAIWMPAGVPHWWRVHGTAVVHLVGMAQNAVPISDVPVAIAVSPLVRELVIAAARMETGTDAYGRLIAVLGDQLTVASDQAAKLPQLRDARLRAMSDIVSKDLAVSASLSELAEHVGTSARTLSRRLDAETGLTFPQWRMQLRFHRANLLLAQGEAVSRIATTCGWNSPSAFIVSYRKAFGRTPGSMRSFPTIESGREPDYTGLVADRTARNKDV